MAEISVQNSCCYVYVILGQICTLCVNFKGSNLNLNNQNNFKGTDWPWKTSQKDMPITVM